MIPPKHAVPGESTWTHSRLKALQSPALARHLALLILLAFLVSIAILIWMPWQQNVRGSGQVIAFSPLERRQDIEAPIKGRIKKWYVQEGSVVKKGDLIAEIQDNDPEYLERIKKQKDLLLTQLRLNEAKSLSYELRAQDLSLVLNSAVTSAQAKIEAAEAKLELARQELLGAESEEMTNQLNFLRETELKEKGLSSQRSFEVARMKYQKSVAYVKSIKAKILEAKAMLSQAKADKEKARADAQAKRNSAEASLNQAKTSVNKNQAELVKIETALARQSTQRIKAPRDGVILKLNTFADTVFVKEGEKLATLVPQTQQRAVELYFLGNDIPLISPGREVRLQFEGWPALQFSGWPTASMGTFEGVVVLVDSTDTKDGKFRVVVRPHESGKGIKDQWPPSPYLRQGARVKGWVLLDTVSLGYELWRQFNGFPPQFNVEKSESTTPIKRKTKK